MLMNILLLSSQSIVWIHHNITQILLKLALNTNQSILCGIFYKYIFILSSFISELPYGWDRVIKDDGTVVYVK